MLVASRPIGLFDRYRVPYVVDPATGTAELIRVAREDGQGAELFATAVRPNAAALGPAVLEDARVHARVADPWTTDRLTRTLGGDWSDALALTGLDRPAHVAGLFHDRSAAHAAQRALRRLGRGIVTVPAWYG
jgi:hypothetical protein